jgi:uncharacterized membrane protein YsdA (DUF1294 family)
VLAIMLVAGAALGVPYVFDLGMTLWPILICYVVAVNAVTFVYFGHDKVMAQHNGRRIPERVLHGLAFLGGSLGAYAGMRLWRHKTLKGRFRVVFWAIVVVQVGVIVGLIARA